MVSRRNFLIGAASAGTAGLVRPVTSLLAKASQPTTMVKFGVPPGACDCHTHVIGDTQRFPFFSGRTYTPETAPVNELRLLHRALHMDRVVIVQPSFYGTDNSSTLDAMTQLGTRARGIAVIDEKTPESELDEMNRAGIRGVRVNLENSGETNLALSRRLFQAAATRVQKHKWHIQMFARLSVIEGIREQLAGSPVPVVFDHFGGAKGALGAGQEGFSVLLGLVRGGNVYVKVSAAYRVSTQAPDYPDAVPLAKALIATNPDRILWGSDWPHPNQITGHSATEVTPFLQVDDGQVLNQLAVWAPDPAIRKKILVDNPAKLFGF